VPIQWGCMSLEPDEGVVPSEPVMRPTRIAVGRRVFLGIGVLGALGVAFGSSVQRFLGAAVGSGLGGLLPFGDRFRIYSITGTYPSISRDKFRLEVSGLVERPTTFTLADLEAMPSTSFVKTFQCVTGWRVPDGAWEGVKLSDILTTVGVKPEAVALSFESYDGAVRERGCGGVSRSSHVSDRHEPY
jgi:hypothetical protein